MTVIGAISRGNIFNGLLGGTVGMLLATMGLNPVTGVSRFTFGIPYLVSGIDIVSALIGLFALSEMLNSFQEALNPGRAQAIQLRPQPGALWSHVKEFFRYPFAYTISSIVGIIIGIIPAAGPSIGALLSYGEVRRHSANRTQFGHGAPEGAAASLGKRGRRIHYSAVDPRRAWKPGRRNSFGGADHTWSVPGAGPFHNPCGHYIHLHDCHDSSVIGGFRGRSGRFALLGAGHADADPVYHPHGDRPLRDRLLCDAQQSRRCISDDGYRIGNVCSLESRVRACARGDRPCAGRLPKTGSFWVECSAKPRVPL
jgi:hypothetical protein